MMRPDRLPIDYTRSTSTCGAPLLPPHSSPSRPIYCDAWARWCMHRYLITRKPPGRSPAPCSGVRYMLRAVAPVLARCERSERPDVILRSSARSHLNFVQHSFGPCPPVHQPHSAHQPHQRVSLKRLSIHLDPQRSPRRTCWNGTAVSSPAAGCNGTTSKSGRS